MTNKNTFTADRLITVAVDVQNDFCPGGALAVAEGDQVVGPLNDVFRYTREHNGLTVATRDWHPAVTPHFADYGGVWPVHCVQNTPGAELRQDLAIDNETIIISKGTGQTDGYSAYEGTATDGRTLAEIARPHTPREHVALVIGGLATDYCVLNTVLDAAAQADAVREARQGLLDVYALTDAMRAVNINPEDEANALAQMREAGATLITTREFMEMAA